MSDYPNERDCEHGHRRGKCPHCELDEVREEYETQHRQLTEAWAEVERLRGELGKYKRALAGHLFDGESLGVREAIRSELIEQGLKDAEKLAAAREAFKKYARHKRDCKIVPDDPLMRGLGLFPHPCSCGLEVARAALAGDAEEGKG